MENIDVLDIEIAAMTNAEMLQSSFGDFDSNLRKTFFDSKDGGKECSLIFEGYVDFSDDELLEFASLAEQSCYKISSMHPSHKLQGEFVFKISDTKKFYLNLNLSCQVMTIAIHINSVIIIHSKLMRMWHMQKIL